MAKRTGGIAGLTEVELRTLTPQEKHEEVSLLIPMQTDDCMALVKLKRVPKRLQQGWIFKKQNPLQEAKVLLAVAIDKAHRWKIVGTVKANKLMALADSATLKTLSGIKKEIETGLVPKQKSAAA